MASTAPISNSKLFKVSMCQYYMAFRRFLVEILTLPPEIY
jgi:hypothetical protein